MFTDIVASTEQAADMGDRRWKEVLARHHAVVRSELRRFEGRELDTAGDGFFAAFDRPAQAIECAAAIMDRVSPLGLAIRAGIHMGECEVMGAKLSGMTVHAAARVLALAGRDQILVTGTIRDLTAGSDILYAEQGTHELKGIPGEWRLFSVERVARDDVAEEPPIVLEGDATPHRTRRRAIAGASAAILLVAAGAVAIAMRGGSSEIAPAPNSVVQVDPATGDVVGSTPVGDPIEISVGGGTVWVGSGDNTLQAVDLGEGVVTSTIGLPGPPTAIATLPGSVWVTFGFGAQGANDETLQRIGTTTERIEGKFELGHGIDQIVAVDDSLWVLNGVEEEISRVDPDTGDVVTVGDVGRDPEGLAFGAESLWVSNSLDATVWRLEPGSLDKTGEVALTVRPSDIAFGFGRIWAISTLDQKLAVIDVSDLSLIETIELRQGPRAVVVGEGAVWVASDRGTVTRIDPETLKPTAVMTFPGPALDLAIGEGSLWLTIGE